MKIETFHSVFLTDKKLEYCNLCLDYRSATDWTMRLYGRVGEGATQKIDLETWEGSPGMGQNDFRQYNTIIIGDSLFDENQLKFHNVSKKKDMFDIIDIDEVDGCYYGLFKDESM